MNEYIVVGLLVVGALLYIIRFITRIARGKDSGCSCCSGSCNAEQRTKCASDKKDKPEQS